MDRLLTHIRSRSSVFLSPTRQLSSIKFNPSDLKSRVLLNVANQSNQTQVCSSNQPSSSLFPLPGNVGFYIDKRSQSKIKSFDEKDLIEQLINLQTKSTTTVAITNDEELSVKFLNNKNFELRTYDCSSTVRSELSNLFLNYDVSTKPLTAITLTFKTNTDMSTWSTEVEQERNQLSEQFIKIAQDICNYLNSKQYWVDFIDPSNGKPYYGPPTSDALFETDERFRNFGINIVDLGCCRVIEHLQHGTHAFVGCIFTSASKMDVNLQCLPKEFSASV